MFLPERTDIVESILDNCLQVWSVTPSFAPLAEVIQRDSQAIRAQIQSSQATPRASSNPDRIRALIVQYAVEHAALPIGWRHFNLFREAETVQVILEDTFGVRPGMEEDEILIPHQDSALLIIVKCLFAKHRKSDDGSGINAFLQILCNASDADRPAQDRTMRIKTMIWFVYLVIEIVTVERHVCLRGLEYLRIKFRRLLDCVVEGTIIDEGSRKPGFENGMWEESLFGWLQGEDRKRFVLKLRRQFNLENNPEHANRCLLAEHRRCVFEQVLEKFC
ncbi:MAG: hypothetical protein LLG06_15860 [Desulfobacteraceae bacterium]|nr:hypothetical protein [Desulfobacteraceae bacterium]